MTDLRTYELNKKEQIVVYACMGISAIALSMQIGRAHV